MPTKIQGIEGIDNILCPNCGNHMFRITDTRAWYVWSGWRKNSDEVEVHGGDIPSVKIECTTCHARVQGENALKLGELCRRMGIGKVIREREGEDGSQ